MTAKTRRRVTAVAVGVLVLFSVIVFVSKIMEADVVHRSPTIRLAFHHEQDISRVREELLSINGTDGLPKYPDLKLQTVADSSDNLPELGLTGRSQMFMLRYSGGNMRELKEDIQMLFKGALSREPYGSE